MTIEFHEIGIIHSPFKTLTNMPIQPSGAKGIKGTVAVKEAYSEGLQDLSGFSHIILLYHFHRVKTCKLRVTPFLDTKERGLFATRAPARPNPIGLSIVRLLEIDKNILRVENIDVLDGTPLMDIKPYVPEFDAPPSARAGWLESQKGGSENIKSDDRFG